MFAAAATGFATGLSLILAIGAQNAFVLRQGLTRRHVLPLCLFCALSDAVLIAAGVAGFGTLVTVWPGFPTVMALAGAGFLGVYGAMRLVSALRGGETLVPGLQADGPRAVLTTAAALTWLNPHVYLDTLGLVGAVSTQFAEPTGKLAFGTGAAAASFVFFFGLGYGARLLSPLLTHAATWVVLDLLIAAVMWWIAAGLVLPLI